MPKISVGKVTTGLVTEPAPVASSAGHRRSPVRVSVMDLQLPELGCKRPSAIRNF